MKHLYNTLLSTGFTVVFLCTHFYVTAQAPQINAVAASSNNIERYERIELSVTLTATYTNAYDYDQILVRGIFTAPSGKKDTIEGFFMSDYSLNTSTGNITPTGTSGFRVRYAPSEIGTYNYVVTCTTAGGTATSNAASFQTTTSSKKGFVRKNNSNYLNFDNGEQYIIIGQNLAWQQNNKYLNFKTWTDKLAANKANFIRLWQCHWGLGIEWTGTPYNGLKSYSQVNSFYTDKLLEECSAKDIYMMLCINHHGMVSTTVNPEWNTSPYNAANGGPCTSTQQYFTNATAKALHKNRLRYIVARWGYSRNIMSWELFNEVDWTDDFNNSNGIVRNAVKDWHIEMAQYLKSLDPFKHLVTTSYANTEQDPNVWNNTAIDYSQTHFYVGSPNFETVLADGVRKDIGRYSKPSYTGEFGVNTAQSSLSTADPNGIHIHNAVWATLFSGGMGGGASWWWDSYIEPSNLYYHYKAPAIVASEIQMATDDYKTAAASTTGGTVGETVISPGFGWGRSPANAFTIDNNGTMTPGATSLGEYIYGSQCKAAEKNSPGFTVTFPTASQFRVRVTDVSTFCNAQRIQIRLNGTEVLNVLVASNTTYSISVPQGTHTIAVDNLGGDWFRVASYTFTNVGSPLNTYVLKSADNRKFSGWIHNKKYNWIDAGPSGAPPAAVTGATITLTGIVDGAYEVKWYECLNGTVVSTVGVTASGGSVTLNIPNVNWDLAFHLKPATTTNVRELSGAAIQLKIFPNPVTTGTLQLDYELKKSSPVTIELLTVSGKKVTTIFTGTQASGKQLVTWNRKSYSVPSGIYFIRMQMESKTIIERVILGAN